VTRRLFENFIMVTMTFKYVSLSIRLNSKTGVSEVGTRCQLCFYQDRNEFELMYSGSELGIDITLELMDAAEEVGHSR